MTQAISIILADAQYLIRLGLRELLSQFESIEIVAEASDEEELIEALSTHEKALVVIDYAQPGYFNTTTPEVIKSNYPNTNILVISSDENKENIYQVLESGVNSYITKTCGENEIVDAVRAAAKAEKFFCSKVLDYLLEKSFPEKHKNKNCAPIPLSPREIEIVRLIAQGLIAKEIARELNLSTHTIYTHRKNIMKKLKLSSVSELMIYAVNQGLVKIDN
jgi:DNA-binding NarL/FixJ family response regulator